MNASTMSSAPQVQDVIQAMEAIAPTWMAVAGDRIGLQVGNKSHIVRGIGVTIDATTETLQEAVHKELSLVIAHHPRIYQPLKNVDSNNPVGQSVIYAIQQGLNIYTAHTNLDTAPGGVNDCLADKSGLVEKRDFIELTAQEALYKIIVYAPEQIMQLVNSTDNLVKVTTDNLNDQIISIESMLRQAMGFAGAGNIGNYSECFFRSPGKGTFRGNSNSHPTIGQPGKLEEVDEWRIETICPESRLSKVLATIRNTHPYEEPAIDVIPLKQKIDFGLGRIANLQSNQTFSQWISHILNNIKTTEARVIWPKYDKMVHKAAVWSGASAPLQTIATAGADALVCGEISYHDIEIAEFYNLPVLSLGHGFSEAVVLESLCKRLQKYFPWIPVHILRRGQPRQENIGGLSLDKLPGYLHNTFNGNPPLQINY